MSTSTTPRNAGDLNSGTSGAGRARTTSSGTGATPRGFPLALLPSLHCPYCESPLEVAFRNDFSADQPEASSIHYGILSCACARYPVIEGVPILQHTEGLARVVGFVQQREYRRALLQALNIFRVQWAHRSRWHQLKYHLNCRRALSPGQISFAQAVDLLRRPQGFSDYLFHRFANPSLLAALAPLRLFDALAPTAGNHSPSSPAERTDARPPRVLDLACGAGHASFLLRLLYPNQSLVSADQDFVSLYLAGRFLAPDAIQVCFDSEAPSPFADDTFDGVFCLDAFHYFHAKAAIIAELQRVVRDDGLWVFPHLHNALQTNFTAGIPLSPEDYARIFSAVAPRLFAERDLLRALSTQQPIDWSMRHSLGDLESAPALTLIGGPAQTFGIQRDPLAAFCRPPSRLAINPIYRVTRQGDNAKLELNWPQATIRAECGSIEAYLPTTFSLLAGDLQNLAAGTFKWNDPRTQELIRHFVLVPLPAHYT